MQLVFSTIKMEDWSLRFKNESNNVNLIEGHNYPNLIMLSLADFYGLIAHFLI